MITLTPFLRNLDGKVKEVLMVSTDVSTEVKLTTRLQANFLATFQSLASIIDARDSYTGKHSSNVHFYTALILKGLDLSEELASDILTAAMLHDIGKVGISDDILKKVGSLEQREYPDWCSNHLYRRRFRCNDFRTSLPKSPFNERKHQ